MIRRTGQDYSRSSCSRSLLSLVPLLRLRLELDDDPLPIWLRELLVPRLLLPLLDDDEPLLPCCCWRDFDPLDWFLLDD